MCIRDRLDALKAENIDYVTLDGVQANPTLAMAREGIELGKKEGVDFILAVGGGSVIDSAKCIADGIANPDVDVWKFYMKEETPKAALPVGVILTLSATGSEMSASSVITNTEPVSYTHLDVYKRQVLTSCIQVWLVCTEPRLPTTALQRQTC